ncbi:MAG: hypothetical protein ACT4OX_09365 [Actinomycetota bacterium]
MIESKRQLYLGAASRDGVFTIEHARAAELSEAEIAFCVEQEWRALYQGVYLAPGTPLTWPARVRAACLAGAPHAVASHRTAGAFYGLPGGLCTVIEITCPRWLRSKHPALLVHESTRIGARDVRLHDGVPVVAPELLLLQYAAMYRSPAFVEKVLHSMRRRRLVTFASVHETFGRFAARGRPGVRVLRAVLERWDPQQRPTESDMETAVLQILRDNDIPRAIPQHEIRDAAGAFIARPDLSLLEWLVAIEYESMQEHTDEMSLARDAERRNRLVAAGWRIVEARHLDVKRGGPELVRVLRALIPAPQTGNYPGFAAQI